jgi:hypothetical protein
MGFGCKYGQSFVNRSFCQKAGHKQHTLPAHSADDDLLLNCTGHITSKRKLVADRIFMEKKVKVQPTAENAEVAEIIK